MTDAPTTPPGHLLVVCTANICRSPMAATMLRSELAERGRRIDVRSAGFRRGGEQIDRGAVKALARRDLDAGEHRSTMIDRALIDGAFLILTMTARHVLHVIEMDPSATTRTFMLREFVDLAEAAGGLDPDRPIAEITAELDAARDRSVMTAVESPFDVQDPHGRRRRIYERVADLLETDVRRLADLITPATAADRDGPGPGSVATS
ncbi:MAG: hypothetical protein AAFZ07_18465 [Actinomycetota bacterium]